MKKIVNPAGIVFEIDTDVIDQYAVKLATSLTGIKGVSQAVYKSADELQAIAVDNASGKQVVFNGNTFKISRQSGELARKIQVERRPLAASVIADTEYASYIEEGVLHPVDMKPFLIGKTVPIRVAGPKGNRAGLGPIQFPVMSSFQGGKALGNSNQDPATTNATKIAKTTTTGKKAGAYYVIFRRVTKDSHGWIIPPRLARPFMAAAAAQIAPKFAQDIEDAVLEHFGSIE